MRATDAIESRAALDSPAAALRGVADRVLAQPRLQALLRGVPLGHAAHPLLTDVPIGMWVSASALDLLAPVAGRRASQRLVGLGVLAAAPTVLTGLADWRASEPLDERVRRVGVVHAAANATATAFYAGSWLARRRGRHTVGVALALAGGTVAGVGGYLGGHLTLVRRAPLVDPHEPVPPTASR
ncbi:hypothetical protein KIN34_09440 [Cellulomonas sp. DKR-3]|uniref:DUF2231 domain-containing protein n=1 Tax=Cellulomonas fulva TaxID=2835530 RepID=A0ABS5TZE3_9CELL|nr:hypothetical protein [Cellulomonas fulva]